MSKSRLPHGCNDWISDKFVNPEPKNKRLRKWLEDHGWNRNVTRVERIEKKVDNIKTVWGWAIWFTKV